MDLFKVSDELAVSLTGRNLSDCVTKQSYQLLKKDEARRSLLFYLEQEVTVASKLPSLEND
jgi:hypothetical protein